MADHAVETARQGTRVLIVDDDPPTVRVLRDLISGFRHERAYVVETAPDGAAALAALERGQYDLVLLDVYMPEMNGLELLAQMRRRGISTPVLILTGNNDGRTAGEALASGILAYVPKPFDFTRLEMLVALATSSRPISAATLGAPSRERQ
jgi:CheY-like chemotaxis protein